MPPPGAGELLDPLHAAADEEFLARRGGGEGLDEPPVFDERGIGGGEWPGDHRAGGHHALLPDESLHLAGDRRRPFVAGDRRRGIGARQAVGREAVLLRRGDHGRPGEPAERQGGNTGEEFDGIGEEQSRAFARGGEGGGRLLAEALLDMGGDGRIAGDEDERRRPERIEDDRHAAGHAPVPQRAEAPRRHLPGLMGFGDAVHEERHGGRLGRHVAVVMAGDDLPPLDVSPRQHHPRSGGFEDHAADLGIARRGGRGKPPRRPPRLENAEAEVHRADGRSPDPRLVVVAIDPPRRGEEDAPGAGGHRRQARKREALRIDRQPTAADPGQLGRLPGGARVELGGEGGEERGAGAGEPGAFAEPGEVVAEFDARPQHGAARDEHVDVPRQAAEAGVGRGDERPAGMLVAGAHPSGMLGEGFDVGLRQAASHVPHEDPVPVGGEHRQAFRAPHVDVGEMGGRADDPQAGAPGFVDLIARRRGREADGVEPERRDDRKRLAVVVEGTGKERLPGDFEHPAIEP